VLLKGTATAFPLSFFLLFEERLRLYTTEIGCTGSEASTSSEASASTISEGKKEKEKKPHSD